MAVMTLVSLARHDAVAVITLDRPPVNALAGELIEDLHTAVTEAAASDVRAVVITGSPHFAAGADITAFKAAMDGGGAAADLGMHLSRLTVEIESLPKPVIAAVRGFALGGGLELALACDFRFLADDARVGQPEIKLGIIPGAGGTQRLPRLIGLGKARDLNYSGRMVEADEALAIGLADRVVPAAALLDEALAAAAAWAEGPTLALGIAKRVMNEGLGIPIADALALEADGFAEAFGTEDAAEGVAAFLEKRQAHFSGS
jgi:enoyl-CoA hydratase/carnithine racemase